MKNREVRYVSDFIVAEAGFWFLSQKFGQCSGCNTFVDGRFRRFMKNVLFSVRLLSELQYEVEVGPEFVVGFFEVGNSFVFFLNKHF